MDASDFERQAELLVDLGRHQEAAELLDRGLSEHPEHFELLSLRGWVALHLDDLDLAHRAASTAVGLQPDAGGTAYTVLAGVHMAAGRKDEAIAVARRGVELDPHQPAAYMLLATCLPYASTSDAAKQEAYRAVERALELAPDDADRLFEAAQVAEEFGDRRAAQGFATAGLAADPTHVGLQVMSALDAPLTGDRAAALTGILVANPTHREARHALAGVVFATIARLAGGVWIYALGVMLLSAWIPAGALRYLAPMLIGPLIAFWLQLFIRLRKRLPPKYLSKRLWRNRFAACGVLLAGAATALANLAPVLLVVGWSSPGVRLGYQALILACLVAGLAHVLVVLGSTRCGHVDAMTDLNIQSLRIVLWLFGLVGSIGLGWAFYYFARQPGALWFASMLLPIVTAVLCLELTQHIVRQPDLRRWAIAVLLLAAGVVLAGCAGLVFWFGHETMSTEFRYQEGPLSPGRHQVPTVAPITPLPRFTPAFTPTVTPGG